MSEQTPPRLDDPNVEHLTAHIQGLLETMESLPFPKVQQEIFELLNCIDLLHREALTRLVELIEEMAPEIKLAMANDYAIQTLMMLYNFVPGESDTARPVTSSSFVPLDEVSVVPSIKMPVWIPGGSMSDLVPGSMQARKFEEHVVLLCRIENQVYALQNNCIDSALPLDRGTLEGATLICPWHGCRYDVRTGELEKRSGLTLTSYPVQVDGGRIFVGFNIPEHRRNTIFDQNGS